MRALPLFALLAASAGADVQLAESRTVEAALDRRLAAVSPHAGAASPCGPSLFVHAAIAPGEFFPNRVSATLIDAWDGAPPRTATLAEDDFFFLPQGVGAAFDSSCVPHALANDGGSIRLFRFDGAAWQREDYQVPRRGAEIIALADFSAGSDGRLHALFHARDYTQNPVASRLVWGVLDATGFVFRDLDAPALLDVFAARADAEGRLHILASEAGDFEYARDLVWGRCANFAWTWETVRRAAESDYFPLEGDLALAPDGTVFAAASVVKTVVTGSHTYRRLEFFHRFGPANWGSQTVAAAGDGYWGTDGNAYTGANPQLALDAAGGLHLTFSDIASWHAPYQNAVAGQWRHAYRPPASATWSIARLVAQQGQAQAPNPLQRFAIAGMAVAPAGARIDILGADERTAGSTLAAQTTAVWRARNTAAPPRDRQAAALARILAREIPDWPPADFDGNDDGRIDAGDVR